ncbi:hypothetical protein TNCT_165451 [Trichonephila clavata]|uniref:Uncharacterized protein n=1 Tax=Trichonephila clavata TaxID=2740835 RepID=A0A8X6HD65_TRICU|nr:hypothetical protein TNCT_165451 [Trichonephila clavata]
MSYEEILVNQYLFTCSPQDRDPIWRRFMGSIVPADSVRRQYDSPPRHSEDECRFKNFIDLILYGLDREMIY